MALYLPDWLRHWQPPGLLDLAVISLLVHRLIVLFRGTATLQVTAALALLWLLQAGAVELDLILTSRFLEWLGTAAVLLIVVAFRDEIREVLLQTSPVRLLWGRPSPPSSPERLHEAVEAALRMAQAHVGALIVFQNQDRLGTLARDGTSVGARLSGPLLEALFAKESPVHDGALIVRGDRIDRVGAILPLTNQGDVPAQFGTRHRAALGLSEQSDAVILVVSEERGEVSVVHRGQVLRVDQPEEAERVLRRLLRWDPDQDRARRLRQEVLQQTLGFGLTVLGVLGYWTVFYGRQSTVTTLKVPIEFRNTAPGLEPDRLSSEQVTVQVRGQRPLIADLKARPNQLSALIDLSERTPGTHQSVTLGPGMIEHPAGLQVLRVDPARVTFDLQRLATRTLPVRVPLARTAPAGLVLQPVEPAQIVVTGPEPIVARLESVSTEPIDGPWPGPGEPPRRLSVPLTPLPARVRSVEPGLTHVRVTLRREAPPPSTSAPSAPAPTAPRPESP